MSLATIALWCIVVWILMAYALTYLAIAVA